MRVFGVTGGGPGQFQRLRRAGLSAHLLKDVGVMPLHEDDTSIAAPIKLGRAWDAPRGFVEVPRNQAGACSTQCPTHYSK